MNPPSTPRTPREPHDAQTYAIIGAAIEVQRTLGNGFLEKVYQLALAVELRRRGVPFETEVTFPMSYKGETLGCTYRADFVCYGDIIVELKALPQLTNIEVAQVLNYLKASGKEVGLLLNFGRPAVQTRRLSLSPGDSACSASSVD
jgi:GxxExxY protein